MKTGTPEIGSRWRHAGGNVYEYLGAEPSVDPCYHHAMKLVDRAKGMCLTPLGHTMHVELAWFEHAAKRVSP